MSTRKDPSRVIRAPRGSEKTCKSWQTEAAYRMLQNNLDAEVAERPDRTRRLRRHRPRRARLGRLRRDRAHRCANLDDDETLLVQSGKPVGVFRTHERRAARAASPTPTSSPHWATWEHFNADSISRA